MDTDTYHYRPRYALAWGICSWWKVMVMKMRFSICKFLTTDQGHQFDSGLFSELLKRMGVHRIRSRPYHPQNNGAIKRWHKSLKAALKPRLNITTWVNETPMVWLGVRTALRSDCNLSAAKPTYGRTPRLPDEFFVLSQSEASDPVTLVHELQNT